MIGRTKELQLLEELYRSKRFEFLVLYGRRRVGKTTLLNAFRSLYPTVFFSAQEKNDALNLDEFSEVLQAHFNNRLLAPFRSWKDAFQYVSEQAGNDRTVLIIDEFPYMATENPSVKSSLQHIIDHSWKHRNIFLILCGSNISFMEENVMGSKSPLYGRATAIHELMPFDYLDSAGFFPKYTPEQKLIAYSVLGGIPRYLEEFDDRVSLQKNIEKRILNRNSFLHEEPLTLLRMEVREPARYNSILEAIAEGINKGSRIADRIHEEQTTLNKYLHTLKTLRLIQKSVPCGDKESSKRGIHRIADPFFCFWYRFLFANRNRYDLMGDRAACAEIMKQINDYCGLQFEIICEQYMRRLAGNGKLPFLPHFLGKWWGNNPAIKQQDDIDVLALSKDRTEGIFCECKFRNRQLDIGDYYNLKASVAAFPDVKTAHFYLFSKGGFSKRLKDLKETEPITLISPAVLLDRERFADCNGMV